MRRQVNRNGEAAPIVRRLIVVDPQPESAGAIGDAIVATPDVKRWGFLADSPDQAEGRGWALGHRGQREP
jgi:hypothetical protein